MKTIVCMKTTAGILTKEIKNEVGRIIGYPCHLDGAKVLPGQKGHVVYTGTDGKRYVALSTFEVNELLEKGKEVFQNAGDFPAFFIAAPDVTINGFYGEKFKPEKTEEPAKQAAPVGASAKN